MEEMKKLVLKLDLHDDKQKQKAMMAVSGLAGVDSISVDMKERKLTVIGDIDPVTVVSKLRKNWPSTEIVSVGLAKEPEKKKKGGKKDDGKKDEGKKDDGKKEKGKKDDGKEGGKKDKGKKEEGKKDDGKKEEGKKDDGKKKEGKKDDGKKKEGKKDDGKEDGKKDNGKEGKKGDGKKKDPNQQYLEFMKTYGPRAPAYMPYYVHNVEENPNTCVIS